MDPSQKLLEQARAGDAEAFWRLAEPHRGLIYAAALAILKDRERAEDQVHDVLLRAFRAIGNLREAKALPSWLYAMTRNHVLDLIRSEERARRALHEVAVLTRVIPMTELMEKEAWLRRMEAAMPELPEPFREILALKYLNHYDLRQIAEILGLTVSAIKSRLFQARKALRHRTEALAATEADHPSSALNKEQDQ
jgi:RNA polymerase sigma factor (sigma-70 family)